jgi:DHA1 family bicyclomycin/chloramphenicol resistance-like MFS transporter
MRIQSKIDAQQRKWITVILLILLPISGMAVDLIAPSLPAITQNLSLTPGMSKGLISIYLLGYAIGSFIFGLLTDSIGRKHLLRYSLFAFIIISLAPIFLPNFNVLLTARLLQGLAIAAVSVCVRAILSDIYDKSELVKMGTIMGTMWGVGPVVGPFLGGYLQLYFGWKSGFYFFAIIALILTWFVILKIPETIPKKHSLRLKIMRQNLSRVIKDSYFMSLAIAMGIVYGLLITFNTLGPFFIQNTLGHSASFFGNCAFLMGLIFLASTFLCRFLLKRYPYKTIFRTIVHIAVILSIIAALTSIILNHSLILLLLITAIMYLVCAFIFPLSMGKGLTLFRDIQGYATAVMYFVNIIIASLIGFAESFISIHNNQTLIITYTGLSLVLLGLYWFRLRREVD